MPTRKKLACLDQDPQHTIPSTKTQNYFKNIPNKVNSRAIYGVPNKVTQLRMRFDISVITAKQLVSIIHEITLASKFDQ
jgi:hypothetical protein